MSYLNKEQLRKLLEGKPQGSTDQQIIESLIKGGHTFEGIEHIPVGIRTKFEPQQIQEEPQKGILQKHPGFR